MFFAVTVMFCFKHSGILGKMSNHLHILVKVKYFCHIYANHWLGLSQLSVLLKLYYLDKICTISIDKTQWLNKHTNFSNTYCIFQCGNQAPTLPWQLGQKWIQGLDSRWHTTGGSIQAEPERRPKKKISFLKNNFLKVLLFRVFLFNNLILHSVSTKTKYLIVWFAHLMFDLLRRTDDNCVSLLTTSERSSSSAICFIRLT